MDGKIEGDDLVALVVAGEWVLMHLLRHPLRYFGMRIEDQLAGSRHKDPL